MDLKDLAAMPSHWILILFHLAPFDRSILRFAAALKRRQTWRPPLVDLDSPPRTYVSGLLIWTPS